MDHSRSTANVHQARRGTSRLVRYLPDSVRTLVRGTTHPKLKDDDESYHYPTIADTRPSKHHTTDWLPNLDHRQRSWPRLPADKPSCVPLPTSRTMSSQAGEKEALATLTKTIAINALLLLSWYANSVGISVVSFAAGISLAQGLSD